VAAVLVQSIIGGTCSASVAANGSITTSAGGFAAPTTAGNLLVLVLYTYGTSSFGTGVSWSNPAIGGGYSADWSSGPFGPSTVVSPANPNIGWEGAIYWIADAPSMSPSQTTTVEITNDINVGPQTIQAEFDLYEFSGVVNPAVYDLTDNGAMNSGTSSAPSVSFSATANEDLILVLLQNDSGNLSPGSGYTLGINSTEAPYGQLEYQLGAAAGQTSSGFTGTATDWSIAAIAFSVATSSPSVTVTGVSPSSGPTAGGTAVTITGTNFLSGATVSFGGNAATSVVVVSSTSITCVTPAGSAGYVTVSVTDSDGTGSESNAYLYTEPILDVSPSTLGFGAVLGGANPASQNVSVSNGDGGTLAWSVSSDESWLTASPTSGGNSNTVAVSVSITGLAVGTYTGHLTFSASGALDSPQVVTITLTISSSGGGGGGGSEYMFVYFPSSTEVDFTPIFSPVAKQPEYQWGLEAKRADSITASGLKTSVCERIDQVTTVKFPYVALSDMPAWKAFESYALGGGTFFYRPNIGWSDDTGFLTCAMISMDWTPKFKSFQAFSLDMKLRLVAEAYVGS
jgi:IPT/TIG domain/Viral BACON domain